MAGHLPHRAVGGDEEAEQVDVESAAEVDQELVALAVDIGEEWRPLSPDCADDGRWSDLPQEHLEWPGELGGVGGPHLGDEDGLDDAVILVEEEGGEGAVLAVGEADEEVDGVGTQDRVVEGQVAEVLGQVVEGHVRDAVGDGR